MWSFLIELVAPGGDFSACLPYISKPLRIQAFISEPTVKAFHMCILNRLSWLNVHKFNALIDPPSEEVSRS
jgi:hypothetical protein